MKKIIISSLLAANLFANQCYSTADRVKALGVFKGMNIDEVINYLVDKEKNESNKMIDYRKRG